MRAYILPWPRGFCIVDVVNPIKASAIDNNVASGELLEVVLISAGISVVVNVCVGRVEVMDVVIVNLLNESWAPPPRPGARRAASYM
jgi:hypothetical protein